MSSPGQVLFGKNGEPHFRWRSGEVSRVEGLSDGVFGFAITLLVVSLEVPKSFNELLRTLSGLPVFMLCFAILIHIWYWHYIYFRRYGLQDLFTIVWNAVLLFVVLFYIYPMKFLYSFLIDLFFFRQGQVAVTIKQEQVDTLMIIFSLGYAAVFMILINLYSHAYRRRNELQLDPGEVYETMTCIQSFVIQAAVAWASVLIAWIGGWRWAPIAGVIYFVIGPACGVHGYRRCKRREKLFPPPAAPAASQGSAV